MARLGMLRVDVDEKRTIFVEASSVSRIEALGDRTVVHLRDGEWFASGQSAEVLATRYDRLVLGFPAEAEGNLE